MSSSLHLVLLLAQAALMASSASGLPSSKSMSAVVLGGSEDEVAAEELWWHHAVVYQVYPRSFMDSNGDGIGDLNGITSKLDYLKDIGVTAVWLSPFYPSPQKDFGYDIKDFKDVDPTYGTLQDFDRMVETAHDLGMKVVVDLVPNHSSDEHEWFQRSVQNNDKYKDYYIWHPGKKGPNGEKLPPNNWVSHFRFSAWNYSDIRGEYYLHQFAIGQPDLNYRNPEVVAEMKGVFTFWMDRGVDGFRVDALPFLFETEDLSQDEPEKTDHTDNPNLTADDYDYYTHPYTMDMDETYDMTHQWRELIDSRTDKKPRVMMTECYTTFDNTIRYYGTKDKLGAHFTFNFQLITSTSKASTAQDVKQAIDEWLGAMDWRWPNWVIGNHDNKRVATRYPDMADAMNMVSLTLPGTAMTYYGEELGMTDAFITWEQTRDPQAINAGPSRYLETSRDPCRTPMQWDDSINAGFSSSPTTWMPTNPNYWELNVVEQKTRSNSHLNVYKDLTTARKTKTMRDGSWATKVLNNDVLAITRSLDNYETYITLVNFGSWETTVRSSDISNLNLRVYTAAASSRLSKGASVPSTFVMHPKESIVLTSLDPTTETTSTRTTQITTATDKISSTTPKNNGREMQVAVQVSLGMPLVLALLKLTQ